MFSAAALLGAVMAALLWPERHRLESLVAIDPVAILPLTKSLSLGILGAVVAILAIIAAADFLFNTASGSNGRRCRCAN